MLLRQEKNVRLSLFAQCRPQKGCKTTTQRLSELWRFAHWHKASEPASEIVLRIRIAAHLTDAVETDVELLRVWP